MRIDDSGQAGFFDGRNQATRIEAFDAVDHLAGADLRSFFRRMGAEHLHTEVLLPLLQDGDSQVFAAFRDRPWPPWGLGARQVSAVCQVQRVGERTFGISDVYVGDEDLTNVGLIAGVYKEVLERLLAAGGPVEVDYLVAEGGRLADRVLTEAGFARTEDVFVTEGARYFTYAADAAELLGNLGLDRVEAPDLLLHDVDDEVLRRNALLQATIRNGSRAEWSIGFAGSPAEILRLTGGAHFSPPGGGGGTSGTKGPGVEELPGILVSQPGFLTEREREELLDFILGREGAFEAATVMAADDGLRVDPNLRRARTLDRLEDFESLFAERLTEALPAALAQLEHEPFPLGAIEIQATASGDRDYFRLHRDTEPASTREISFVYFAHREPKRFSGGELRVFQARGKGGRLASGEGRETVSPRANEIVFFPSACEHEVLSVRVPSNEFADGRFTVNGWIHRAG